jgi:hypothetical protein
VFAKKLHLPITTRRFQRHLFWKPIHFHQEFPNFALGLNHIDPTPIDSEAERRTACRGFSMTLFKFSLFLFMMPRMENRASWISMTDN